MKLENLIRKVGEMPFGLGKRADASAPRTLIRPRRIPYGPFRFEVQVPKGATISLEPSTDLRHWTALVSLTPKSPILEHVDSEAFKFNHRFYRALANGTPSTNVIGYASSTVPPGFCMIANPFGGSGSVEEVLPKWPDGTSLNRFDTRLFRMAENVVQHGKWLNPTERLTPGEGAIFFNPTSDYKLMSFVGEVPQGHLSVPIPAGFSIRSSLAPKFGSLQEELTFPIGDGDVVHLFDRDRQKYVLYPFADGVWSNGAPVVSLCESFWIAKTDAANWVQTLVVNP